MCLHSVRTTSLHPVPSSKLFFLSGTFKPLSAPQEINRSNIHTHTDTNTNPNVDTHSHAYTQAFRAVSAL